MLQSITQARQQASDIPDTGKLEPGSTVHTGYTGRPRFEINAEFLSSALQLRGVSELSSIIGCSPRTIRRRALELGIAIPGPSVFVTQQREDGSLSSIRNLQVPPVTGPSDEFLDNVIKQVLDTSPNFGRRLITGHLLALGVEVSRARIQASYARVHGPSIFLGSRGVQRRTYNVAGPNSLCHHDGQHGLIRWKIVIHGFIDGYSRFVTGIRAHNNNRAQSVFNLFMDLVRVHGLPSRVRGDHGGENIDVAEYMELVRGVERGSYIWGRSV
jgi:hypothetical protein